jgi:hypothetical protein
VGLTACRYSWDPSTADVCSSSLGETLLLLPSALAAPKPVPGPKNHGTAP